MNSYPFGGKYFAPAQLNTEIVAAGLNPLSVIGEGFSTDGAVCLHVTVQFASALTPAQVTTLNNTVAAHAATITNAEKLDLANLPVQRILLALCVLSATSSTAGEKTKAQSIVDNAYNQIKSLLA